MRNFTAVLMLVALLPLGIGCGVEKLIQSNKDAEARSAVDSVNQTNSEAALLIAGLDVADVAMTSDDIATAVAAAAATTFTPADCVTALAESGVVTYNFNMCSGPHGLANLDGVAVVSYSKAGDTVNANLTSTDLGVLNGTMTMNATAALDVDGTTKTITVQTTGVGIVGTDPITRAGQFTAEFDATCINLSGEWTSTVNETAWATALTGYERCGSSCPADGGQVVFTGASASDQTVLTISFDGTNTVSYVSADGLGSVTMSCN